MAVMLERPVLAAMFVRALKCGLPPSDFTAFARAAAAGARRRLRLVRDDGAPGPDLICLEQILAAAQSGADAMLDATLDWFARPETRGEIRRAAKAAADRLFDAGLGASAVAPAKPASGRPRATVVSSRSSPASGTACNALRRSP